jgi:hypothetical protein
MRFDEVILDNAVIVQEYQDICCGTRDTHISISRAGYPKSEIRLPAVEEWQAIGITLHQHSGAI